MCKLFGHQYDKFHATKEEKEKGYASFFCKRCGKKLTSKITICSDGTYKMDPNPINIF